MAVTFLEKRKRLRFLMPVLAGIVLITAVIIWRGFFVKEEPFPTEEPSRLTHEVEINFQVLESTKLENLQVFEKTPPLEEEAGRENPFLPSQKK